MSFRTLHKCERFNAFCTSALEREMEVYNFDKKKSHIVWRQILLFLINNFNLLGKIAIVIVYDNTTCEWIGLTAKFRTREEQLSWGKLGEI